MTRTRAHPPFGVAVDLVVLTVIDGALQALLIERGEEPFAGEPALPGGFVHLDEGLDEAAARELAEETGVRGAHLEQLVEQRLETDRKSTRLNSSHVQPSRMPSSA